MEFGVLLSEAIVQFAFPVLGAILMIMLSLAARKLDKKLDTEIFTQHLDQMQAIAMDAASYAEENAATWAKNQEAFTSNDVINTAVKYFLKRMPNVDQETAQEEIESILAGLGYGAAGKRDK